MSDEREGSDPYSWDAWEPGAQGTQSQSGGSRGAHTSARDNVASNNYGNMRAPGGDGWQSFPSPEAGASAIANQLDRYASGATTGKPVTTLRGMISTWAPPTDNNPTSALITNASKRTGLPPDVPVDLSDPDTRRSLTEAITQQENPKATDATMAAYDNVNRPVPAPQPRQPGVTEPKVIGPFHSSYDAYEAAPKDRDNFYLLNRGGSYIWQPKGPAPADQDPTKASPYLDDTAAGQAMDAKVFQTPGLAGNQISNSVTNIGRGFNKQIASVLDIPATVADWGLNAISAGVGYKPTFQFGHPVEGLMNRLGFETDKRGDDGWANVGWGIGTGLGMVAPMMITGGLAAAGGPAATAADAVSSAPAFGSVGRTVLAKGTGFGQGATAGTATTEALMGGGGGAGQEEAHEFYKSQTGREGDLGDVASQFIGGGLFNAARIPLFMAAEKAGLTAAGQAWKGAKEGIASLNGAAVPDAPLNAMTGKKVTDQVLGEQLARHLDHADETVAALGTANPADSANYLAERSTAAREAVNAFAKNSRTEERAMWDEVNPSTQIDFSATRQQYQAEKAAHFGGTLRDPQDFPSWLEPLLSKNNAQQPTGLLDAQGQPITRPGTAGDGLNDIDTLGRGQNLRARLNQAIDDERMAAGRAQNPALIGYMQRIRNSLGQDMENTSGGVNNDEIDAYRRAMSYSASRSQIMESQPMSQFLSQKVGDASALQKFLRQGPAGADAAKAMLGAAQAKYGSGGLLSASKDAIRQMYTDAVAPHGFVDVNAHNAFMKNYGAVLGDPAFADVQQQLNTAAAAGRNVNDALGAGKPTNFGRSESALDARTAASDNYLGAPTATVLRNLQGSSNALHGTLRVLGQLDAADATGRAGLGFQHQVAQMALDNPGWAGDNQGIISAIDRRNPGFVARTAYWTNPTTLGGVTKQLFDAAGALVGAKVGSHIAEGGMGSSLVMAGRGAKITEGLSRQIREKVLKISSANIVDPAADAAWQRLSSGNQGRLYTAAQKAQDMVLMHSYVPGLALGNLPIGSGSGTGNAGDRMGPPPGSVPWQQVAPRP